MRGWEGLWCHCPSSFLHLGLREETLFLGLSYSLLHQPAAGGLTKPPLGKMQGGEGQVEKVLVSRTEPRSAAAAPALGAVGAGPSPSFLRKPRRGGRPGLGCLCVL